MATTATKQTSDICADHGAAICSECGYCIEDPEHLKHDPQARLDRIYDIARRAANGGLKIPGKSESIRDLKNELRRIRELASR